MADPLINNVTLTANGADNEAFIDVKNAKAIALYLDYTKGDEQHMHCKVSFSSIKDDAGSEIWFDLADSDNSSGQDNHILDPDAFRLNDTGKVRIPIIPLVRREDKVRVQVWAESHGGSPGSASVYYVVDKEFE